MEATTSMETELRCILRYCILEIDKLQPGDVLGAERPLRQRPITFGKITCSIVHFPLVGSALCFVLSFFLLFSSRLPLCCSKFGKI